MSDNEARKETFFPGVMKPLVLDDFTPLANAAGEKRVKLSLVMSLSDNQLLGIPEWLEDAINLVRKADGGTKKSESIVELDGVILRFYTNATDEKAKIEIQGVLLKKFVVQRVGGDSSSGELADSELVMHAYCYYMKPLWDYAFHNFNRTVLCSFGTLQAKLSFGPPKKDGVPDAEQSGGLFDAKSAAAGDDSLSEETGISDDEEDDDPEAVFTRADGDLTERAKEAVKPEHDALFAGAKDAPARKPRGNTLSFTKKPN